MKEFRAESKRLLELMVNSIYTNKEIFLRELISNASDAIDKLHFLSLTDTTVSSDFSIGIEINKEARTLTITDGGVGMTEEELNENLGTIAKSGTLAFKKENKTDEGLIGQFGVGFYSAFMVADKVTVKSRKYGADKAYAWECTGLEGYTIEETVKLSVGSEIILHIKPDDEEEEYSRFLEVYTIEDLVKRYSDYIRHPIKLQKEVEKQEGEGENTKTETVLEVVTLNSMVPVWKKPKNELTEDELKSFYQDKFGDMSPHLKYFLANIEGNVNYTSLLFVPEKPPFDYYSKDYQKGLMLHSNGVLIMEKCADLLPDYFSFIRGVVDSPDLSLNISREMLQKDRQLKVIATSIEKKLVSEFSKWLSSDRKSYETMFKAFGASIKLGIYESFGAKKDTLQDLLVYSSSAGEGMTTLKEYVSRFKENQTEIFYAVGESEKKIRALPYCERLLKEGYEILFLTDKVDEFVIKMLRDYDGKNFKAAAEASSLLSDEDKAAEKNAAEENKDILSVLKAHLKGRVKDVRFTSKLTSHAVCVTSGNDISIEMEKVLKAMPNAGGVKAEHILEINAAHPIVATLKKAAGDEDKLKNLADVLYNSALIVEGLSLESPEEYVEKLMKLIY